MSTEQKSETQSLLHGLPENMQDTASVTVNPGISKIVVMCHDIVHRLDRQDEATAIRHVEYRNRFSNIDSAQAKTNGSVTELQWQSIRDEEWRKYQEQKNEKTESALEKIFHKFGKMTQGESFKAGMVMAFQKASTWIAIGSSGAIGFCLDHWSQILKVIEHLK